MKTLIVFRDTFNSVKSRYSFLTVTALLMTAGVFVYYFYFLTSREEALDQRQLRALNRIESTLNLNMQGYKGLAIAQSSTAIRETIDRVDSITKKDDASPTLDEYQELFFRELQNISFFKSSPKGGLRLSYVEPLWIPSLNEDIAFLSQDAKNDSLIYISVYSPIVHDELPEELAGRVEFTISLGAVFRPLLRNDLFDEYFIVKDTQIVYATVPSGLTRLEYDTLSNERNAAIRHILINGTNYRAYPVGISLNSEAGWSIIGLVSEKKFAAEKRAIPRQYLFIVFLLIVFIVLSIPFIKSLIMSRTERLGSKDLIFSAISLALTASVAVILIIDGYMKFDLDSPEKNAQLEALSSNIETNLKEETAGYVKILEDYGAYINKNANNLDRIDSTTTKKKEIVKIVSGFEIKNHPTVHNMFLVDQSGYTIFDRFEPEFKFNVSPRPYVTEVLKGNCIGFDRNSSPVFIDAIISWREQRFRAAISIPTPPELKTIVDDYPVIVLTSEMRSVADPVLPTGAGFAIFNANGNVLFHSDSLRCLNENIFEECDNDPTLRALVTGRTKQSISLDYSGTPTLMYVRPLAGMPYFIATFLQREPTDAIHGQVFGFAFILQILLLVWFMIIILFSVVIIRRRTRLHIPLFTLTGFVPQEAERNIYLKAVLLNFTHGVLLFGVTWFLDEPLTVVALFFIVAPYTVALNVAMLSNEKLKGCLKGPKRNIFWGCLLIIILTNSIAAWISGLILVLIGIQIVMLCIFLLLENYTGPTKNKNRINNWLDSIKYKTAYSTLIYVLMVLISIVPAIRFSIIAYDKEKEIEVKTAQLTIYKKLQVQGQQISSYSHYHSAFFGTTQATHISSCDSVTDADLFYDSFSAIMRERIQSSGEIFNRLKFGADDGKWEWHYAEPDSLVMKSVTGDCSKDSALVLGSSVGIFRVPFFGRESCALTLRFWFGVFVGFVVLYIVLRSFVSKIFVLEKYSRNRLLKFDEAFFDNAEPGYKAFVTGMPSAGKSAYFAKLSSQKKNVHLIDFVSESPQEWKVILNRALEPGRGIVLLDHFEHNLLDYSTTLEKLKVIEQLIATKDKKVIIISSVQPLVFLHLLEDREHTRKNKDEYAQLCERWNRALAAFYDFVYPLQGYESVPSILSEFKIRLTPSEVPAIPNDLIRLIEDECSHGIFMRSIGVELLAELHAREKVKIDMAPKEQWKEREDIVIRTQKLADNYYRSVWNNLAVEEQFVLYDLAQDGLVNPKNLDVVESLIDRGLVFYRQQLEIMNHSFRNFILCVVGPADISKLEVKMKHAGTWNNLRFPLLLIVCALLLFVVKSDRTALFGYFTAFTAIIPLVVSLFGLFGKPVAKKE